MLYFIFAEMTFVYSKSMSFHKYLPFVQSFQNIQILAERTRRKRPGSAVETYNNIGKLRHIEDDM